MRDGRVGEGEGEGVRSVRESVGGSGSRTVQQHTLMSEKWKETTKHTDRPNSNSLGLGYAKRSLLFPFQISQNVTF